jgi:hypothetical protein
MAKTWTVTTPSLISFEIRETTGADDQRLTAKSINDAEMLDRYIYDIIVSGGTKEGTKLSYEALRQLKLRDKYALLIFIRMLGLSPNLIFTYPWPSGEQEYSFDLGEFVWDYKLELPQMGDEAYSPYRIIPYLITEPQIILYSLKVVKFDLLNGLGEAFILGTKDSEQTINTPLLARNLMVQDGGDWKKVVNFSPFTSREMMEIRNYINEVDPPVTGEINIESDAGDKASVNILSLKEFFYPAKI